MSDLASSRRVRVAQAVWLLVAIVGTAAFAAGPISQWAALQTVCHPDSACQSFQLDASAAGTLSQHGSSPTMYAVCTAAVLVALWVLWYGLAALIVWRKPDDRGAVLCAFFLVIFPLANDTVWISNSNLSSWLAGIPIFSLLLFALLFPDGYFAPRWTRWLAGAIVGVLVVTSLPSSAVSSALNTVAGIIAIALFFVAIAAQIQRYRSISSWAQRQQTKWGSLGLVVAILGLLVEWWASGVAPFPTGNGSLYAAIIGNSGLAIITSAIPVSIAIAVLRSGLWDIDRVINRALVYTSLSVTLAGIYIGSVVGLQTLFRALTGQQSGLVVALSTLIIAVLFNPLRHRIQDVIAHAFYRRRYNAAHVLAAFGATCRDQTDLELLRAGLLQVVDETMQPRHVSLWLVDVVPGSKT
jgi:hypothetical protein